MSIHLCICVTFFHGGGILHAVHHLTNAVQVYVSYVRGSIQATMPRESRSSPSGWPPGPCNKTTSKTSAHGKAKDDKTDSSTGWTPSQPERRKHHKATKKSNNQQRQKQLPKHQTTQHQPSSAQIRAALQPHKHWKAHQRKLHKPPIPAGRKINSKPRPSPLRTDSNATSNLNTSRSRKSLPFPVA